MYKIAQFLKVSFEEFRKDWKKVFPEANDEEIRQIYDDIKLPCRATRGSAGYDFFAPIDFSISPKQNFLFPSGVRVKIDEGWFLAIMPKSGLGFKYRLQLDNTVAVIDADYFNSDNEGHIFIKMTNDSNSGKTLDIKKSASVCQGVFLPFGITCDDKVSGVRNGGLGSTSS